MKTKLQFLTLLMLLLSINLFSQQIFTDESRIIKVESKLENSKLSLSTKSILLQAKQNISNLPTEVNLSSLVRITLLFESNCTNYNNENIFLDISKISENISTAFVKVEDLTLLENIQCLKYADIGENLELEVSNARAETNTNSVHLGTGLSQSYTGTGVIVGVIDSGLDYTHPNFKDSSGNLRIKKVWEQINTAGSPPIPFNYGSEFISSTAILNKMRDMVDYSHGTHVTGIAAGSGNGNPSLLKGMAPDADIILVSRGGDLVGEIAGTSNSSNLIDAVNYIKNYANSVSKPAVINMSFGTNLGPHDGTDLLSSSLNSFSSNQGLILVKSAGNDGGEKEHALNIFNGNQTKFILNNKNIGSSKIDIWGNNLGVNSAFGVTIGVYNTSSQTYDSNVIQFVVNGSLNFQNPYNLVDVDFGFLNDDNWTISLFSEINPLNNRPHLRISCTTNNDSSSDFLVVSIQSIGDIVNSWCNGCEFDNPSGFNFTDGDDYFSITEPGNATGIITVGSFNVTNDNLGTPPGTIGGLSYFSSKGPRADLVIKPDVAAPGNRIVSSLSSFDTNYQLGNTDITNTFGTHTYGKLQGTSMAAPVLSGIIALWLQAAPQLTTNDVRTIIANTSITASPVSDSFLFYGTTYSTPPNVKWGYGKINAYTGIQYINQFLNVETFDTSNNFIVYPNPTSSKVYFDNSNFNFKEVAIYNYLGQEVTKTSFSNNINNQEIDMSNLATGVYVLKFSDSATSKSVKVVKQ